MYLKLNATIKTGNAGLWILQRFQIVPQLLLLL